MTFGKNEIRVEVVCGGEIKEERTESVRGWLSRVTETGRVSGAAQGKASKGEDVLWGGALGHFL